MSEAEWLAANRLMACLLALSAALAVLLAPVGRFALRAAVAVIASMAVLGFADFALTIFLLFTGVID